MLKNSVGKYKKRKTHWENCQNTDTVSGTMWSTVKSENGRFPRRIVFFYISLGFVDVFGRRSHPEKGTFFTPGPNPKVLIVRWKRC